MTEDCILWRGFSTNGHLVREQARLLPQSQTETCRVCQPVLVW